MRPPVGWSVHREATQPFSGRRCGVVLLLKPVTIRPTGWASLVIQPPGVRRAGPSRRPLQWSRPGISGRGLMTAVEQALDPPAPVDAEAAPARADDASQRETGRRATSLAGRVRAWLPEGGSLPEEAWWQRHRVLLVIIALHWPAIVIYAMVRGYGFRHGLLEASVVAAFGLLAIPRRRRDIGSEGADGDAALLSRKRRRL